MEFHITSIWIVFALYFNVFHTNHIYIYIYICLFKTVYIYILYIHGVGFESTLKFAETLIYVNFSRQMLLD